MGTGIAVTEGVWDNSWSVDRTLSATTPDDQHPPANGRTKLQCLAGRKVAMWLADATVRPGGERACQERGQERVQEPAKEKGGP